MDEVARIREKTDLIALISEFIPLKKTGRNFKANCPFHNEKTPSFVVSPERQIWHCFGCQKGGDVFTFLMEYENIEFPEALRILAKRAGIELRESDYRKGQTSEKEKIFEINSLSLKFYNYILNNHKAGTNALEYLLAKRKLNKGVLETFSLGFAPNTLSGLSDYLQNKKKYKAIDLISAGVSIQKNGKLLDFFKNRIIFPLFDHRGNVTGFSGRALNDIDMPKYINTKETLVYHKGSMFFGFNLSKEEIKKQQDAVIVEGEFDVISLFMAGIINTVAIKGTALTEEQVNLLSRFTPKITLCLDQDEAGFDATKRSLPLIEKKGLTTNVISLKDAKDPDEAVKKDPISFKVALRQSQNIYDFLISHYTEQNKEKGIEGKKQTIQNLLPLLSQISNEIIKEHYVKKLSKEIDSSIESIEKEINKIQKKEEEKVIDPQKDKRSRRQVLEEYLLALIIQNPKQKKALEENKNAFSKYKFETPSIGKIIEALSEYFSKNENFDNNLFINYLDNSLLKSFDVCYLYPLPKFETDQKWDEEIDKVTKELINLYVKERVKEISIEINAVEDKESEKAIKLQEEVASLLLFIKKDPKV